jgi:AmmeMemoRadiSam system protein A
MKSLLMYATRAIQPVRATRWSDMALISSTELDQQDCQALLHIARDSIRHGLEQGGQLLLDPSDYGDALKQTGACFVTLNKHGKLRGCIGTLQAYQPLVKDVADHAYAAAFSDPRFPALNSDELDQVDISISILGEPEEMSVTDEEDLCRQLTPGSDGLILECGSLRGTFLPSVWESLPDCHEFVRHLKQKAGLDSRYWSDEMVFSRYSTRSFSETES